MEDVCVVSTITSSKSWPSPFRPTCSPWRCLTWPDRPTSPRSGWSPGGSASARFYEAAAGSRISWPRSTSARTRRPRHWGHLEIEYEYRSRSVVRFRDYNHVLTLDSRLDVHTGVVYLNGGPIGLTSEAYSRRSFGRVPCTFRYHSLGISQVLARQYLARPEPLAWALAVLARPKGLGSRADLALACLRRIQHEKKLDESRRFKLLNFVHTYAKLDADAGPEYWDLLRTAENQEVQEMLVTWADEMKAEGRQEGIEKMRDVVMDVMTQRFGGPFRANPPCHRGRQVAGRVGGTGP